MLVVNVYDWPDDDSTKAKVVGVMSLTDVPTSAEVSDYEGRIDGRLIQVHGHRRADGAWSLIKKVLDETVDPS